MKRLKVLSLAALVAFAACDEGSEPITVPDVTGTISGAVTIEGTAKSGVSVTLSSGAAATTDASGQYSFAGVKAGTYTVTISGFPTDATFSTTTKGATIATSGQVQTVNFDGAYVRTSAILGSVAAGGSGLAGVKVTLSGTNTAGANVNTDANGQYAFTGLRAGSYTVTISGFDATQYAFASSTASVTVAAGQSQVASFNGTKVATAKITGTVTIDAAPAAGVTATLSTGATATTDAAGAYTFSNLTAGTYTVTISGFAADATFTSVAQTVTIATAGSTANANFAGTYIKTASIVGTVTVGATGLPGVKVTLNTGATVNTDANGQYSFVALRAGTYTVTVSGFDTTMYSFAATSEDVTVAAGESALKNFAAAYVATAKINGMLFLDENVKNNIYDGATVESVYALSGVTITIEGGAVNNLATTTTSDGLYEFPGLVHGTYRVTITPPAAGTFGWGGASVSSIVTLTPGATATVNFPFDILKQYVTAEAFLGADAGAGLPASIGTRVRPEPNVTIDLYDTYANAVAGGATGKLGTATTDANGAATFSFLRATDTSPAGAADNIVFARYVAAANPNRATNGEATIEIKYNAQDTLVVAPDEFDLLNTGIIVRFASKDGVGNSLNGWAYNVWDKTALTDTILPADKLLPADLTTEVSPPAVPEVPAGYGRMVISCINGSATAACGTNPTINLAAVPVLTTTDFGGADTLFVRLNEAVANNTLNYTQTAAITTGVARTIGGHLGIILDGTQPDSITLAGTQTVKYTQARLVLRSHREQDDVVKFTAGDPAPIAADPVQFNIYNVNADGSRGAAIAGGPFLQTAGSGVGCGFSAANVEYVHACAAPLAANKTYLVTVQPTPVPPGVSTATIISDTAYTVFLSGKQQADTVKGFNVNGATSAMYSSFAWKANNLQIQGVVSDATAGVSATGLNVWVKTAPTFVGPSKDTVVTVQAIGAGVCTGALIGATGAYCTNANLLEGPYTIEALDGDSASVWQFKDTLTTTSAPVISGGDVTGALDNTSASKGSRDAQGTGFVAIANFRATRMDTKIQGAILNDRDGDTNTIDGGEALVGATVDLIGDTDADGVIDSGESVLQTITSGADGSYEFTGLQEGDYIVRASSTTAHVTRALNGATGAHTNFTVFAGAPFSVKTTALVSTAAPLDGPNGTMRVGTKTPASNSAMPAWNYATDGAGGTLPNISTTHFTFLAKGVGQVDGGVNKGAAAPGVVLPNATVYLTRCYNNAAAPITPTAGVVCTKIPGTQRSAITGADGKYQFTGLDEGVYVVEVDLLSVGLTTRVVPVPATPAYLLTIKLESSVTDIETVPNFVIF